MNIHRLIFGSSLIALFWHWPAKASADLPPQATNTYRYHDVTRVVAIADVHGAYDELLQVLRTAGVSDHRGHWTGGRTHLVSLGDLVDRGPDSVRVLELMMRLERQAAERGGRVHVLLGNHEVMLMAGDYRYLHAQDYAAFEEDEPPGVRQDTWERFRSAPNRKGLSDEHIKAAFDEQYVAGYFGLQAAYSPTGRYGSWLRTKPIVVVINDNAFVHGGISAQYAQMDLGMINRTASEQLERLSHAHQRLVDGNLIAPETGLLDAAHSLQGADAASVIRSYPANVQEAAEYLSGLPATLMFHPDGPLWYRGNALCQPVLEESTLTRALHSLSARRLIVGHTPTDSRRVESRFGGRLIRLDTGMLTQVYHGQGFALQVHNDELLALSPGTNEPAPPLDPETQAALIENMLRTGTIDSIEEIGIGITRPRRVNLSQNGAGIRAVFKSVNIRSDAAIGSRNARGGEVDRFSNEVAAYRLDRLLGLAMVPVTVERRINGQAGSLQLWIEGASNEKQRRENGHEREPVCPMQAQYAVMDLFDRLIFNPDRTLENVLYDQDWQLRLIDHSRAFRSERGIPAGIPPTDPDAIPRFASRLAALDEDLLRATLSDLLDARQMRALLKRRREILSEWNNSAHLVAGSH